MPRRTRTSPAWRRWSGRTAATLNLCRAFTQGGYADLCQVHTWNTDFVAASPAGQRYEALASGVVSVP